MHPPPPRGGIYVEPADLRCNRAMPETTPTPSTSTAGSGTARTGTARIGTAPTPLPGRGRAAAPLRARDLPPICNGADLARGGVWRHRSEEERLESLASYHILDTPPEPAYDAAARLAARVCDAPAGMVSLVDHDRQWLKAVYGLEPLRGELARAHSVCSDAVALGSVLVLEDTLAAPRYAAHPLVAGAPGVRAYAGVPLIGRDGLPLGTICALDWRPRAFTPDELENLAALAEGIVAQLELRRSDRASGRLAETLLADARDARRLRRAIEEGEFFCRYQPIVDMATGAALAFEALVRWQHPVCGELGPASFLPAIERTGLMRALGRRVLADAVDLAAALRVHTTTGRAPAVTCNVSGGAFDIPGFADEVAAALRQRAVPATSLTIEVTESVPFCEKAATRELRALAEMGVLIALDDYGQGTATAGRLAELPIGVVKLDALLATGLDSPRTRAVVASTVALAEEIGVSLIGEGIETRRQRDELCALGVRIGQGWLFDPPLTRADVLERRVPLATPLALRRRLA